MTTSPTIHLTYRKTPTVPGRPPNALFTVTESTTGRDLCSARTPLCSAARILLQQGHAPSSTIYMTREGETSWSLRATLGTAARLTVRETEGTGPVFVTYDEERMAELKARKLAA